MRCFPLPDEAALLSEVMVAAGVFAEPATIRSSLWVGWRCEGHGRPARHRSAPHGCRGGPRRLARAGRSRRVPPPRSGPTARSTAATWPRARRRASSACCPPARSARSASARSRSSGASRARPGRRERRAPRGSRARAGSAPTSSPRSPSGSDQQDATIASLNATISGLTSTVNGLLTQVGTLTGILNGISNADLTERPQQAQWGLGRGAELNGRRTGGADRGLRAGIGPDRLFQ